MKLKQLRIIRGLTQSEFATIFGISQNTLSNYENGKREPSVEWLKLVSKKMNCPLDYLTDSDQIYDGRLGQALKDERKFHGYSLEDLSKETKIPLHDLKNYEEDIESINYYLLSLICDFYELSVPEFYVRHEMWDEEIPEIFKGDVDAHLRFLKARDKDALTEALTSYTKGVKIPVLGRVVAGIPIEAIPDILDYEEISSKLAATGDFFALKVQGNSMAPRICEGDVVIVRKQEELQNKEVGIILVNGNEATIKEFHLSPAGVTLVGWNVAVYQPHFYDREAVENLPIQIIGKVVEVRGKI